MSFAAIGPAPATAAPGSWAPVVRHVVRAALVGGFAALLAKLFLSGELSTYLSPDIDWLTVLSAAVLIAMAEVELERAVDASERRRRARATAEPGDGAPDAAAHGHSTGPRRLGPVPAAVIVATLAFALWSEPQTVSPAALGGDTRTELASSLIQFLGQEASGPHIPASTPITDFPELVPYLQDVGAGAVGQTVRLEGEVFPSGQLEANEFAIARISVFHCVSDGQPIGVVVATDEVLPPNRQWVAVAGTLEVVERDGVRLLAVNARSIEYRNKPARPYIAPLFGARARLGTS